jgi:hypothetical protein
MGMQNDTLPLPGELRGNHPRRTYLCLIIKYGCSNLLVEDSTTLVGVSIRWIEAG